MPRLLPRWRGAAPIHRAIEAGDARDRRHHHADGRRPRHRRHAAARVRCRSATTPPARLHDRLAALGGRLIVEALELAACGGLRAGAAARRRRDLRTQDREGRGPDRLVAARRRRSRGACAPSIPSRAPAACSTARRIKLWARQADAGRRRPTAARHGPGRDARGHRGGCGQGVLRVTELQRAGGKRLAAADFLRGFERRSPAMRFDAVA